MGRYLPEPDRVKALVHNAYDRFKAVDEVTPPAGRMRRDGQQDGYPGINDN
jgi:hypothetical protein